MSSIEQLDERHWHSRSHWAIVSAPGRPSPEQIAQHQRLNTFPPVVQVLVGRHDSKPLGNEHFAVLQAFKNAIFGPEYIGFEVYPPESELRNRANVYWLQVYDDPTYRPVWLKAQTRSVDPAMSVPV